MRGTKGRHEDRVGEQPRPPSRFFGGYLPPSLVRRAAAGRLRLDEPPERRVVTVMFMDLVGFTTMSEHLGADRVAEVLNRYLTRATELAHEHGATTDKFVGDAVMIVFGAPDPVTAERQAHACVALAMKVRSAIAAFDDPPLAVRIGINNDEAVVGHFGSPISPRVSRRRVCPDACWSRSPRRDCWATRSR